MNFLQQTSLGLSFLWLAGSFAPALASAAKSARRLFLERRGQKDPSWIDLATSYGNPYVRDDVDASLSQQQLASWWELFHDDTLTELISLALENNKKILKPPVPGFLKLGPKLGSQSLPGFPGLI